MQSNTLDNEGMYYFTDNEMYSIAFYLRIAAERFKEHQTLFESDDTGVGAGQSKQLAHQFKTQLEEAIRLADIIDNAEAMYLTPQHKEENEDEA